MRHEKIISLGHGGIVNYFVTQFSHWVNLNLFSVILNADAGMNECMKRHRLATFGLKHVGFVVPLSTGSRQSDCGK